MRLLFVKLKHIGDALLLTSTLSAVRTAYPAAEIWVVVRSGTQGILAGCPAIDRLMVTAAPEKSRRSSGGWLGDVSLLRELRRQRFDYAFELGNGDRGRLLVGASGARLRCAYHGVQSSMPLIWRLGFNRLSSRDWTGEHQVETNFNLVNEFLPLGMSEPPPLVFDRARTQPCELQKNLTDYIVIHPGTRWQRKRWPVEKWIACGRELLQRVPQLVISVGPDPEEVQLGEALVAALGPQAVSTRGQLSWSQLAGLLYGAKLFVGVDTAAMHLAAACQCPTVALFAASVPVHWRPWGVRHQLVGAALKPGEKIEADAMRRIELDDVMAAVDRLLAPASENQGILSFPPGPTHV